MEGIIVQDYPFPDYEPITRAAVVNTCIKMKKYLTEHDKPLISVSGGSDSDCIVHLVCTYFPEFVKKCHFVFVNTGLEYKATKNHLSYLEQRYGIQIHRIRGESVATVIRKHGIPILNKSRSDDIYYYLREKPWAIYRIEEKEGDYGYNPNMKAMIHYIKDNGIKVAALCCKLSKKKPIYIYAREQHRLERDRRTESGKRSKGANTQILL